MEEVLSPFEHGARPKCQRGFGRWEEEEEDAHRDEV
jgi:hypothetical protein